MERGRDGGPRGPRLAPCRSRAPQGAARRPGARSTDVPRASATDTPPACRSLDPFLPPPLALSPSPSLPPPAPGPVEGLGGPACARVGAPARPARRGPRPPAHSSSAARSLARTSLALLPPPTPAQTRLAHVPPSPARSPVTRPPRRRRGPHGRRRRPAAGQPGRFKLRLRGTQDPRLAKERDDCEGRRDGPVRSDLSWAW